MNAKSNCLKLSLAACVASLAGGCGAVPMGYTVVVENDVVVWESFGRAKLERLPQVEAPPPVAATTTWEFPGHPILGVWSAPETVTEAPRDVGMSRADVAFLRELARTDGNVSVEPFVTPSETAVASR